MEITQNGTLVRSRRMMEKSRRKWPKTSAFPITGKDWLETMARSQDGSVKIWRASTAIPSR
jgi:hypothetical protein